MIFLSNTSLVFCYVEKWRLCIKVSQSQRYSWSSLSQPCLIPLMQNMPTCKPDIPVDAVSSFDISTKLIDTAKSLSVEKFFNIPSPPAANPAPVTNESTAPAGETAPSWAICWSTGDNF
jgi:hypothetical protein